MKKNRMIRELISEPEDNGIKGRLYVFEAGGKSEGVSRLLCFYMQRSLSVTVLKMQA